MSHKIWGDVGAEKNVNEQSKNVNVEVVGEEEQGLSMYPHSKETFNSLTEMDEECRKLKVEETRLRLKKLELIRNKIKLMMDTVALNYVLE
ncbi:unnamed protein product [Camellia sinensis]